MYVELISGEFECIIHPKISVSEQSYQNGAKPLAHVGDSPLRLLKGWNIGGPVSEHFRMLFFEKRCKNVPIEIIVSAGWKYHQLRGRYCDVPANVS